MLYRKNIYTWEQMLRIVGGLALTAWAVLASGGGVLAIGLAITGLGTAASGVLGWCPACAVAGRRLKDKT